MSLGSDKPKLEALTGLRYWAALSIFLHHMVVVLGARWGETGLPRPELAIVGMPLFFTLSGFLMYYNYFEKFQGSFDGTLKDFLVARFARIYPLYLFALLMSFSAMGQFFHLWRDQPRETAQFVAFDLTLTQSWFFTPIALKYGMSQAAHLVYLGVAWSISVEVFFYLTFPFLCIPIMRWMTSTGRIIGTAVVVVAAYVGFDLWFVSAHRGQVGQDPIFGFDTFNGWLMSMSPYARYGEFLIGCLTGGLFAKVAKRSPSRRENLIGSVVMSASIVALVGLSFVPVNIERHYLWCCIRQNIGNAPFCAAIIFCLARYRNPLQSFLSLPMSVLLGEASYGIYLMHSFVQNAYSGRSASEGEIQSWDVVVFNHLAMIMLVHVIAVGAYQLIETPARRKLRDWFGGARKLQPALAVYVGADKESQRVAA